MQQTAISRFDVGRALSDGLRRWNKLESNLSALGLTFAEFRVLRVLSTSGTCSMVTLAIEQGMTAPGMTLVIDKLEEAGLVRRVRSDADRRAVNVVITGRGGEKLKRAFKLHDMLLERALRGMSIQEITSFLAVLNRILTAAEDKTGIS